MKYYIGETIERFGLPCKIISSDGVNVICEKTYGHRFDMTVEWIEKSFKLTEESILERKRKEKQFRREIKAIVNETV